MLVAATVILPGRGSEVLCAAGPVASRESKIPAGAIKMTPATDLHPPKLHLDGWQAPEPVPGLVNTAGAEDSPFVTPDGMTLYFFFTPDLRVPPHKQIIDGVTGIYVARKAGDAWGKPQRVLLQEPGKLALDGAPCVAGDTLWFCSVRPGNFRTIDFYTARLEGQAWTSWRNAGKRLNDELKVGELHVTADGRELYFHADRPGGKGKLDIWMTRLVDGRWQDPINLQTVNSPENDAQPFLTADGQELWFTRPYRGTPATFRSKNVQGRWSAPEVVLSQFAGEPAVDRQGNIYFVHHFLKHGKLIEADIYVARRK